MNTETNPAAVAFVATADSRETSPEIMQAIAGLARDEDDASRIWDEPTEAEALSIWETVTKNGLRASKSFFWGAAGERWATELGVE